MILRGNVSSDILGMDTGITIVAPNHYHLERPYQIAYLLHGLYGNNGSRADNTMLPAYANKYHIIFVLPDAARSFYTDKKASQL